MALSSYYKAPYRGNLILYVAVLFLFSYTNIYYLTRYGNDTNRAFVHSHDVAGTSHVIRGNNKNLFSRDDGRLRINVCISVPAYLEYGGIEYWIRSFAQVIEKMENQFEIPLRLYGLHVWDLNTFSVLDLGRIHHVEYMDRYQDLEAYCNIVMTTASWIIKTPGVVNVMVIHGDNEDNWTNNYARMHYLADYVVSVSNFHFNQTHDGTSYTHIPTMLLERGEVATDGRYRYCERQLLYVGRISEEKRSHLVCEFACAAGGETCAVLLGDYYFAENKPKCMCQNVYYLGFRDDVDKFMQNSDFLLVPSKSEGGPIVAIEAWQHGLPVIMKKTGLGNNYPQAFLLYDWDNYDYDSLAKVLDADSADLSIMEVKQHVRSVYEENFSEAVILSQWHEIFAKIYRENFAIYEHVYYPQPESSFMRIRGKRFIIDCWRPQCTALIVVKATKNISLQLSRLRSRDILIKFSTLSEVDTYSFSGNNEEKEELIQLQSKFLNLTNISDQKSSTQKIHIDIFASYNHLELWDFTA